MTDWLSAGVLADADAPFASLVSDHTAALQSLLNPPADEAAVVPRPAHVLADVDDALSAFSAYATACCRWARAQAATKMGVAFSDALGGAIAVRRVARWVSELGAFVG